MRTLPFLKYSPCGNMTLLIRETEDNFLPCARQRAAVAAEIIAPEHLGAEQAGFVRPDLPLPHLEMMGGEFCLNATRAFAALLLEEGRLQPETGQGEDKDCREKSRAGWCSGLVSVSGADSPLRVFARQNGDQVTAAVQLERPSAKNVQNVAPGLHLVRLPGIAHLVLDAALHPLPSPWEKGVEALLQRYQLMEEDAAACVWLGSPQLKEPDEERPGPLPGQHRAGSAPLRSLTPFVRVRATGTTCAESACGSGTLAAALVAAMEDGEDASPVRSFLQISGETLSVALDKKKARVEGAVRLIARGEVCVFCLDTLGQTSDKGPHGHKNAAPATGRL